MITLSLLFLSGQAQAQAPDWNLVGVYDATALGRLVAEDEGTYVWRPSEGMTEACGPEKAPDGLGVQEAAALANGMTPTLAIVLQRAEGVEGPLTNEMVRVGLGNANQKVQLQPAVEPRYIAVTIEGGNPRHQQLVRTQIAMETCMEHKTGRGWIGGSSTYLRQAFLLDERNANLDRRYFTAQTHPVPALLGPPDACLQGGEAGPSGSGEAKGGGSIGLVPADLWGASLRPCDKAEGQGPVNSPPAQVPLRLSNEDPSTGYLPRRPEWSPLEVTLNGTDDEDTTVLVKWLGNEVASGKLFDTVKGKDGAPDKKALLDVMARIPLTYPTVGEGGEYVVLLIPNWQLVEAIRRIEQHALETPSASGGSGVQDGVGWVLEHPEALFVQVGKAGSSSWPDLATPFLGHSSITRAWGYAVGTINGRQPVVTPTRLVAPWTVAVQAQRALWQGVFMGAGAVLLAFLGVGISRFRDMWAKIPEERVAYWPKPGAEPEAVEAKAPEAPGGAG